MGFFSNLFGYNKEQKALQEMFAKVRKIIEDEEFQLEMLHPNIKEMIKSCPAYDCDPNGSGPFGFSETNPIPVNGHIGQLAYLSKLETNKGERILFHRIGSIGTIDVFEAVTFSGSEWFVFFTDLYHPRRSRLTPDGFRFTQEVPQFCGFNQFCQNFPYDFVEMKASEQESGLNLAYIALSNVIIQIQNKAFQRPLAHRKKLDFVKSQLTVGDIVLSEQSKPQTLYDTLGVSRTESPEEIKEAYRQQAMKYHPDRNIDNRVEAEERFKEIGYAYKILSDPQQRARYDADIASQQTPDAKQKNAGTSKQTSSTKQQEQGKTFDTAMFDAMKMSFEQMLDWANRGYAGAQNDLGNMYNEGRGVPKDERKAVEWYQKAAEQGDALAQSNLGLMYANGRGVPKDEKEAAKWFQKAAEQGVAVAQNNLGVMYGNGRGVTKDDRQAVAWYQKAADQGHARAQFLLGGMYYEGRGVIRDRAKACALWKLAAEQGNQNAINMYNRFCAS